MPQLRPIPGTTINVRDLTASRPGTPAGVPALSMGRASRGPAFVPVTVSNQSDLIKNFGGYGPTQFGMTALSSWLAFQDSGAFIRLLGVGKGLKRLGTGEVENAGFNVQEGPFYPIDLQTPDVTGGNPYAEIDSSAYTSDSDQFNGRTYFLGSFMADASGSSYLADAGLTNSSSAPTPVLRAVIMVPQGVEMRLFNKTHNESETLSEYPTPVSTHDASNIMGSMVGSLFKQRSKVVIDSDGNATEKTFATQDFTVYLNGFNNSNHPAAYEVSFDKDAKNYFPAVLNTDPTKFFEKGHLVYAWYDISENLATITGGDYAEDQSTAYEPNTVWADSIFLVKGKDRTNTDPNYESFRDRYQHAKTPWIMSQKFGGTPKRLFRVHSKDDGEQKMNFKVSIKDIAPSTVDTDQYGSFTLEVRMFDDVDGDKQVLESFAGVNLNPNSPRYLPRVVGDRNVYFDFETDKADQRLVVEESYGVGSEGSDYIRIEMNTAVEEGNVPATALPMGFRGPTYLNTVGHVQVGTGEANLGPEYAIAATTYSDILTEAESVAQIPVPYRTRIDNNGATDSNLYWGFSLEHPGAATDPNNNGGTSSKNRNLSLESLVKYFPNFNGTEDLKFACENSDNADEFNYNEFSLENIRVVTKGNNATGYELDDEDSDDQDTAQEVDDRDIKSWRYIRNGIVSKASDGDGLMTHRALKASDLTDATVREAAKFTCYMQGGFDGVDIFMQDNSEFTDYGISLEVADSDIGEVGGPVVNAYKTALKVARSKNEIDMKLMVLPGISEPTVTDEALSVAEARSDCLYLMDPRRLNQDSQVIYRTKLYSTDTDEDLEARDLHIKFTANDLTTRGLDSSYGAAYAPWVSVEQTFIQDGKSKLLQTEVPASVAALAAIARADVTNPEWEVPAGLSRGLVPSGVSIREFSKTENFSDLANANINALRRFPERDGIYIWDGLTLTEDPNNPLVDLGVRRLLLTLKRRIKRRAKGILFDPNVAVVRARLAESIQPILDEAVAGGAASSASIRFNTSEADILNNTLRVQILLQPTKYIRVIVVDFELTNTGIEI